MSESSVKRKSVPRTLKFPISVFHYFRFKAGLSAMGMPMAKFPRLDRAVFFVAIMGITAS